MCDKGGDPVPFGSSFGCQKGAYSFGMPGRITHLGDAGAMRQRRLSTLDRKFGDVFGEHQAALASPERAVLSLSMGRRKSRRVNRH